MAITSVFQTEEMGSIPIIRWDGYAKYGIELGLFIQWVDARVAKGGGL